MQEYDIPCYGDNDVLMNYQFLDTIDFSEYFTDKEGNLSNIISRIENHYNNLPFLPASLDGCIFNYICESEIADYFTKRYGLKTYVIKEWYYSKE